MKRILFKLPILVFIIFSLLGCEKKYSEIINYQNVPPIIKSISAPNEFIITPNDTLVFRVTADVKDEDGLLDIQSVYFNSYRPDSSFSSKIILYDDGDFKNHGDLVKDDGTFSRLLIFTPSTIKGTWRFEFEAVDKSGELSNKIIHYIIVKQ